MRTENDYKLDFVFKMDGSSFRLRDCCDFYLNISSCDFLNKVYLKYLRSNRIHEIVGKLDFQTLKDRYTEAGWVVENGLEEQIQKVIEAGSLEEYYKTSERKNIYSLNGAYRELVKAVLLKTPEYELAENEFKNWIASRPGVVDTWREFAAACNKNLVETQYKHRHKVSADVTLRSLAENVSNSGFRKRLENKRPDKFLPGQVVKLKATFLNKRGKDPFFHKYDQNIRNSQRIGTVLKKINTKDNVNYGVGSREIRVMWFMTGEETSVQEKCLSKVD